MTSGQRKTMLFMSLLALTRDSKVMIVMISSAIYHKYMLL